MLTQEQAREWLKPMNLTAVSEESGVNAQALHRLRKHGKIGNPNLEKLSAWIETKFGGGK